MPYFSNKCFFLFSKFDTDSYGVWSFPDGTQLSSTALTESPMPTNHSCVAAVMNNQGKFRPECEAGTPNVHISPPVNISIHTSANKFPYICEIYGPCESCNRPEESNETLFTFFPRALRVSSTKCIWVFKTLVNRSANNEICENYGMSPVVLTNAYENRLARSFVQSWSSEWFTQGFWIDIIMKTQSN